MGMLEFFMLRCMVLIHAWQASATIDLGLFQTGDFDMPKDMVSNQTITVEQGKAVELPNAEFVTNAAFVRDGANLSMMSPDGETITIEGYFNQSPLPDITTADGAFLSPEMVDAFLPPQHAAQYAAAGNSMNDVSPAGQITELIGDATIVRADGTRVEAKVGASVFPGDVVETSAKGAVNILFVDNTTFAISESARLSIDEFTYDSSEQSGSSFFSMMQGVFVYTSGLIGKNDPGNVSIETPVGSIGIRGTRIAGTINPAGEESQIIILDGAATFTNAGGMMVLNQNFQTAAVSSFNQIATDAGQTDSAAFTSSYGSLSGVAGSAFSDAYSSSPANTNTNDGTNTNTNGNEAPQQTAPVDGEKSGSLEQAPVVVAAASPSAPESGSDFGATGTTAFGGTGDFSSIKTAISTALPGVTAGEVKDAVAILVANGETATTITAGDVIGVIKDGTTTAPTTGVNSAPAGTDKTVTILEDGSRTFSAADFGFSDKDGNSMTAVIITNLPLGGTLTALGVAVTAGQSIAVADLSTLTYTPNANANGNTGFRFQVVDDGSTANGGVNIDQSSNRLVITVTAVNDAPEGANHTIGLNEDASHTFVASDFGFSDVHDGDNFAAVRISTLPANGALTLSGVAVVAGDIIAVTNLANLVFTPVANANGAGYASLTFQVIDDGTLTNGSIRMDQSPNTITLNVNAVNDAPTVSVNAGLSVTGATTTSLTGAMLGVDVDTSNGSLVYNITSTNHGLIAFSNATTVAITSFTQAQLLAGDVVYVNNGSNNVADAFDFTLTDGTSTTASQTFDISITPVPEVSFTFDTFYTKGTGDIGDDNIALFGGATLKADLLDPSFSQLIGTVNTTNIPSGGSVQLVGFDGSGDYIGSGLSGASISFTPATETLFHYDSVTGQITLVNPLAITGLGLTSLSFAINILDSGGSTVATENVVFQFDVPEVQSGSAVQIGLDTNDNLYGTAGNDLIFGLGGEDTIVGGGGLDALMGGGGNDVIVASSSNFRYIDGGAGTSDSLTLSGTTNLALYDLDITATDNIKNVERIKLGVWDSNGVNGLIDESIGASLTLNVKDIFDIVGNNGTLNISQISPHTYDYLSDVNLDATDLSFDVDGDNIDEVFVYTPPGTTNAGNGSLTFLFTSGGNTLTLVVDSGLSSSDGINTNVTV